MVENIRLLAVDKILPYGHVERQVNSTILGSCIYFNKRNLYDFSLGVHMDEQWGSYSLLQTLDEASREMLRDKTIKGLKIKIWIYQDSTKSRLITDAECAVSRAGGAYTISWDKAIKVALQKMFPISTALAICVGKEVSEKIKKDSALFESIGIEPVVEQGSSGGFAIYPIKKASDDGLSDEYKMFFAVLRDYSRGLYLNTSDKKEQESEAKHLNAFEESSSWMNAEEFGKKYTGKQNCIYTLATEPDQNGVCGVYVGEAVVSGNRLKLFSIDGRTYIDHTRREAEERRFTRFRVDMLKDDARPFLHDAQDSIIGVLKMLEAECPNGYTMKNRALCASISDAFEDDKQNRR